VVGPEKSSTGNEQVRDDRYLRDGKWVPLETRREELKVAGEHSRTITVRSTAHGPILSDEVVSIAEAGESALVNGRRAAGRYDVSLAWTGLNVTQTADAVFGLNSATNWNEFRAAAKKFLVPSQNLLYADTDGHIGYQAPGQIPIRRPYPDSSSPPGYWTRPGWISSWDWQGYVPFEDLPHTFDPAEGFLVAANQAVTASGTPFLTTQWDSGFRSQRIRELLEAEEKVTPQRMAQIQGDTHHEFAPELVKALLAIDVDNFTKQGQDLLKGWDFSHPAADSTAGAAAAYYNSVWRNLLRLTFDDELADDLRADGGSDWMEAVSVLLKKPRSPWWDDRLTPGVVEGKDEILRRAMVDARLELTRELGKEPSSWRWGQLHRLTLLHPALGAEGVPGMVRNLFNRGPYDMPGGGSIVNANGWNADVGYSVNWAPSMRMVVDLSNPDASRWVNQTGNSGHAFNDHYDDQIEAWVKNETYPWPHSRKAVEDAAQDTLKLLPEQQQQP
jgi:penicillin amidase